MGILHSLSCETSIIIPQNISNKVGNHSILLLEPLEKMYLARQISQKQILPSPCNISRTDHCDISIASATSIELCADCSWKLRLSNTSLCVTSEKGVEVKGSRLILKTCLRIKNQMWFETDKSELVLAQLLCLDANDQFPSLSKCHEMGGSQEWRHQGEKRTPLYNMAAGMCMGVSNVAKDAYVTMDLCTKPELIQWDVVGVSR
uniref:Ricin B lectin domain-containing protein n=1 Tax=Timema bartmani TaxID=61472 RepID=A0A7R9ETH7_9NEOP|nr:unnamed protein product [Timema bartmani]